ncbi:hypothetical protein [Algoriphagus namhaensis]
MNHLPKSANFKTPKGYFDELPDRILAKNSMQNPWRTWSKYAAGIALIASLGWWFWPNPSSQTDEMLALDSEVSLYIESQYWTAEDILSLSDDPEMILEEVVAEETLFGEEDFTESDLF